MTTTTTEATPTPSAPETETVTESPTPTETPTPTPSEDPTALPPLPEAATENTPEGAEAFIRYYIDVLNHLHQYPQTGEVAHFADEGCESCRNAEERIAWLIEHDAHLDGDLYELDSLTRIGGGAPGVTRFSTVWLGLGPKVLARDGEILESIPTDEFNGIMAAKWEGQSWVFYDSATSRP
ncbi:MAG: DUF6318 family protein [Actinomycetia bacterium]|nr:DUF6318 family protein [Actinomycetes bacterium]